MNGFLLSWTNSTHLVMGSLLGPLTPLRGLLLTLTEDDFGDYTHRALQALNILDVSSQYMTPFPTIRAHQHVLRMNKHVFFKDTPGYEKLRPYFGWVNVDTVQKTIEQSTQWGVSLPNMFPMKRNLKSSNRIMSKLKGWTLQGSLLTLWMDENSSQQSNKNC